MTDYEITTHVRCDEDTLALLLERFARMLHSLGFTGKDLDSRFDQVAWEPDGGGFAHMCKPVTNHGITLDGQLLQARPYILGYTQAPGTPWLQLSLVFDSDTVKAMRDSTTYIMRRGTGAAIWRIARGYAATFPHFAIFFSDFPSVNLPWKALTGRQGDLWWFDLAVIPESLAPRFMPIPDGYSSLELAGAVAIAPQAPWGTLPWEDGK